MYHTFVLELLERTIYGYNSIRHVTVKSPINVTLYSFNSSVVA